MNITNPFKVSSSLFYYFSSFFSKGLQIILLTLYTRLIDASDLGEYFMFMFVCTFLSYIFYGNANSTSKHFLLKTNDVIAKDLFQFSFIFLLFFIIVSTILLFLLRFDPRYIYFSIVLGFSILVENYLLGLKKYILVAILNFLKIITEFFLLYVFISFLEGFNLRYYPYLFALFFPSLMILFFLKNQKIKYIFSIDFGKFKSIFYYSFSILFHTLLFVVLNQSSRYIIGYFHGEEYAGVFSVMQTFGNLILLVSMFYNSILIDKLYSMFKNFDSVLLSKYLNLYLSLISVFSVFVFSLLKLFLFYFLDSVYFSQFLIVTSVFLSNIFFNFYSIFSARLNFLESGRIIVLKSFSSIILGFLISYFLIKWDPYLGVSLSILLYNILLFIFYYDKKIMTFLSLKSFFTIALSVFLIVFLSLDINKYFMVSMPIILMMGFFYYLRRQKWQELF